MFQPVRIGELELKNRIMLSPMDMYVATDGLPDEFHLVHLGGKALGGAGLVMTEMTCVSPEGRITLGCPGIWTDEQRDAWRRVVDFVHTRTTARIGMQLGHSGRKGSTKLMWEGMDEPLDDGNWEVVGPSPLPYGDGCHVPREATRADLDQVVADFVGVRAARGRGGLRPDRGARRPRLPAELVPLPRLQPAHRRRTAARWRTGCGSRWRSSTPSARSSPPTCRSPSGSPRPTGCPTATPTRTPSRSPAPSSSTVPRRSTSRRAR